mmetsp:Transcript_30384/g.70041  ORF Transcript_30384/g.70041 Transcript_30384/m.70041 type:complete len:378 (-) Transcript_30384:215-1348(-)
MIATPCNSAPKAGSSLRLLCTPVIHPVRHGHIGLLRDISVCILVVIVVSVHLVLLRNELLCGVKLLAADECDVVCVAPCALAGVAVFFGLGAVLPCSGDGGVAERGVARVSFVLESRDAPRSSAPASTAFPTAICRGASGIMSDVEAGSAHVLGKDVAAVAAEAPHARGGILGADAFCRALFDRRRDLVHTGTAPLALAGCAALSVLGAEAVGLCSSGWEGSAALVVRVSCSHDALWLAPRSTTRPALVGVRRAVALEGGNGGGVASATGVVRILSCKTAESTNLRFPGLLGHVAPLGILSRLRGRHRRLLLLGCCWLLFLCSCRLLFLCSCRLLFVFGRCWLLFICLCGLGRRLRCCLGRHRRLIWSLCTVRGDVD